MWVSNLLNSHNLLEKLSINCTPVPRKTHYRLVTVCVTVSGVESISVGRATQCVLVFRSVLVSL